MTEIETAFQELTDRVTGITDVVAANSTAIDGAVKILASGVAEIKDLAGRIGTVADDPDMVRTLAAKLKTASDTLTAKQAALTAASADLAAAVVANTPDAVPASSVGPSPAPEPSPVPSVEPVPATPATEPVSGATSPGTEATSGTTDTGGQMDPAGGAQG